MAIMFSPRGPPWIRLSPCNVRQSKFLLHLHPAATSWACGFLFVSLFCSFVRYVRPSLLYALLSQQPSVHTTEPTTPMFDLYPLSSFFQEKVNFHPIWNVHTLGKHSDLWLLLPMYLWHKMKQNTWMTIYSLYVYFLKIAKSSRKEDDCKTIKVVQSVFDEAMYCVCVLFHHSMHRCHQDFLNVRKLLIIIRNWNPVTI